MAADLDSARRREFRRIGHHLQPVVTVGDGGVSEGVVAEAARALEDHELIKIRLPAGDRDGRRELIDALCTATDSVLVQTIGRMALIFRAAEQPDPKKSNILRHQAG
jgi:RNA-binding protein